MSDYPAQSTYEAPITVTDRSGDPLNLSTAEVEYLITERQGRGEERFRASEADPEVEIEPDGETGLVRVTVPASQITWTGNVWEELRVRQPDASVAVLQRPLSFTSVATDA